MVERIILPHTRPCSVLETHVAKLVPNLDRYVPLAFDTLLNTTLRDWIVVISVWTEVWCASVQNVRSSRI